MFNKEKPVETIIDKEKCVKCGLCTEMCPVYLKIGPEGFPTARELDDEENLFGCIQCGNCMMLCPQDAIEIVGEDIDKSHLRALNPSLPDYEAVNSLFLKRRSCRKFKKSDNGQDVEKEIIDKIINSAATAAVSIPPSEVKVLVIQGREKVKELTDDIMTNFEKFIKMSPFILPLMKIFGKKADYKAFKEFVLPLGKGMIKNYKKGIDDLFYEAPCVMVFYGSENTDKEDYLIAATQATIAAEALGLGTCIIGSVGAMFENNSHLRKKYGIEKTDKVGTAFILGYPVIKYRKAFQRNFKEVRYVS